MNILITGGTGSLGNELVEQLINTTYYSKICIYSRGEQRQEEMAKKFNSDKLRFFIGDVRDKDRLAFALREISHVVHAAALKIVPAMEYNPGECIKTNIIGTQNLIEACGEPIVGYLYKKVLLISTDKAVKPINAYGASKLCAEKYVLAANNMYSQYGAKFSVVRYGNVSNSNGSVIPLFTKQRQNNEPLTITDERMSRFYISLEEAGKFVLQSLRTMQGGEVFIPKMPSFRVIDLADVMKVNGVKIIGIRPGEKIHESISDELSSDTNDWWLTKDELAKLVGVI